MKRPAFQFYPADWRKDPALSTCSLAARGLWLEMMCIAHESDVYGHLCIAGNPMTVQQISRGVGESPAVVGKLIDELEKSGVFSRDEKGSIFSRRMVRDERIRNVRADAGRLGGNPNLLAGKVKQNDKQKPTPSSSSSSSEIPPTPKGADRFHEFWESWPASGRKAARGQCEAKWSKLGGDGIADTVLRSLEAAKASEDWRKDGGQFIPAPLVWLNQSRWEAFDGSTSQKFAGVI